MAGQIMFFQKNKADYQNTNVSITATQGSGTTSYLQMRKNTIGFITTGSVDADNTTITVDFVDTVDIDNVFLVNHNLKSYTLKYWNGSAYVDFSTAVDVTANTAATTRHNFTQVTTSKIQLIIRGTMVADSDKRLSQIIATKLIGQLAGWPVIKKPNFDLNQQKTQSLSGKMIVENNVGGFSCTLSVKILSSDADLDIVETLYDSSNGFLVWLCGGDQTQFRTIRKGYRLEDFFLMKCVNDYSPQWDKGLYKTGINLEMSLAEVTR